MVTGSSRRRSSQKCWRGKNDSVLFCYISLSTLSNTERINVFLSSNVYLCAKLNVHSPVYRICHQSDHHMITITATVIIIYDNHHRHIRTAFSNIQNDPEYRTCLGHKSIGVRWELLQPLYSAAISINWNIKIYLEIYLCLMEVVSAFE